MQPTNTLIKSFENYYLQGKIDEDYEKALEFRKLDSQDFKDVCENSYHHKKVDDYKENDHHNKQFPYPSENK